MPKSDLPLRFCPYCAFEYRVKQYGKRNKRQRYKCKGCKRIFEDVDYSQKSKADKKLISALINLTEYELLFALSEKRELDILKAMKNSIIDDERLKKIKVYIETRVIPPEKVEGERIWSNFSISMHGDTIIITKDICPEKYHTIKDEE